MNENSLRAGSLTSRLMSIQTAPAERNFSDGEKFNFRSHRTMTLQKDGWPVPPLRWFHVDNSNVHL